MKYEQKWTLMMIKLGKDRKIFKNNFWTKAYGGGGNVHVSIDS